MEVNFIIPGEPVSKARVRSGQHGFYTPSKTKQAEQKISAFYKKHVNHYFGKSFLTMQISAYFNIPKSYTGSKLKDVLAGKYFPVKKDWDNVGKLVSDALNKVAYHDDRQLVDVNVKKLYCIKGDSPRVEIIIGEVLE